LTDGKQYLQIAKGKQLYSKGGNDAAPTFQPQGRPTNEEFIIEHRAASQHRETNGKEWLGITLPQGTAGFVPKDDIHLITSHDREQLGYKIVREENENADGFIDAEQMPEFFRQLHRDIDAKGTADGKVSVAELQSAQGDPVLRQRWGKLIAYHPTEWQAKSDQPKWQRLHELMKESPEMLRHECERIDNLVFWDELGYAMQVALPKLIYHFHPIEFVESLIHKNCACNRSITKEELKKISPSSSDNSIDEHLESINDGFSRFGITKCREKSHFLAQALHESGGLKFTSEIGGASAPYAPWYGRGLIQLTLKANYVAYENYIGADVTSSTECIGKLASPPHCALSAFWFYKIHKNLDAIAIEDDFIKLTAKINGGFNGYNDRMAYFFRAAKVLHGEHLSILEKTGEYLFTDSAIYGERIYSFGWGLWHDPESTRHGVTKSKAEALQGYRRARDLIMQTPFPVSQNNNKIYGVSYENLPAFINARIQALSER
jgi:predicted chitinase